MFKYFFLLLLSLACIRPVYADAVADAEEACSSSYRDVPVNVTPRFDEPSYNYSASIADITRKSTDGHHSIHEAFTLGLTSYKPILAIQAPLVSAQMPNGTSCAYVDHVDVTIGYQDVTVYIANEIPENTCGFGEVMGHEQKHINVNRQILEEYAPLISSELTSYLRSNSVFIEEDPAYALNILREKLQTIVHTLMDKMSADNVARQKNVDTIAEYRRVGASCNGQLHGVVAQFVNRQRNGSY